MAAISFSFKELLMYDAVTPLLRKSSTWSFIKEISGEMTTVNPVNDKAGN